MVCEKLFDLFFPHSTFPCPRPMTISFPLKTQYFKTQVLVEMLTDLLDSVPAPGCESLAKRHFSVCFGLISFGVVFIPHLALLIKQCRGMTVLCKQKRKITEKIGNK